MQSEKDLILSFMEVLTPLVEIKYAGWATGNLMEFFL